jgi:restriction system protein
MAIWEQTRYRAPDAQIMSASCCLYCSSPLTWLHEPPSPDSRVYHIEVHPDRVGVCPVCGWWLLVRRSTEWDGDKWRHVEGAHAQLSDLDLSDVSQPLSEVRTYLLAKYEARQTMHPRLFETTVASVFSDLGYMATVTAYQGDGGIDVILESSRRDRIGVQVKRYRDRIHVEQIRALTGALFLGGFTRGVFVTTSSFQSGGEATARTSAERGIPIELIDADRFYAALKLTSRSPYCDYAEWRLAIGDVDARLISSELVPTA